VLTLSWKKCLLVVSGMLVGRDGPGWSWPVIKLAAFSAMASTVAFSGALGMTGMTEASATRSPATPWTRSCGSTTASGSVSGPMRQVLAGCQ
jgi:hypothetical protein